MADDGDPPKPEPPSLKDLYRDIERLRRELEKSERARERLKRENERLKKELAAARRAGKRQAAPFSKGAPKPHPRSPGRCAGRRHGRHGHRRPPAAIDEIINVPLPDQCPHCGGDVTETRVAIQIQEDLRSCGRTCAASMCMWGAVVGVGAACRGAIHCRPRMRSALRARSR